MRQELEQQLFGEFPSLYRDRTTANSSMAYGIACGDGWYDLIHDLSRELTTKINQLPEHQQAEYYAVQVKEKFGELRFYLSHHLPELAEVVQQACDRSAVTCEVCGGVGSLGGQEQGWWSTLCDGCREERNRQRAERERRRLERRNDRLSARRIDSGVGLNAMTEGTGDGAGVGAT